MFTGRFLVQCQHEKCIQQHALSSPIIQIQHCFESTNQVIEISATVSTQPPILMTVCTKSTLNNPFISSQ